MFNVNVLHHTGAQLVGREAAHHEDGAHRPDDLCPPALRLPGGQEWGCEEEGSGRPAHIHDAPGL